jgi:hypothetical protein
VETELRGKGRHDPCVLARAVPVVEAMVALVLADALLQHTAQCGLFREPDAAPAAPAPAPAPEAPEQSRLVPVAHKGLLGKKLRGMGRLL